MAYRHQCLWRPRHDTRKLQRDREHDGPANALRAGRARHNPDRLLARIFAGKNKQLPAAARTSSRLTAVFPSIDHRGRRQRPACRYQPANGVFQFAGGVGLSMNMGISRFSAFLASLWGSTYLAQKERVTFVCEVMRDRLNPLSY